MDRWRVYAFVLYSLLSFHTCLGIQRDFYIACIEDMWDYAPGGSDETYIPGYNQENWAPIYLARNATRIGPQYRKAMYREYTDDTYGIQKPRPDWLGFLGPILKAETGDVLKVHFKNMASGNYSMHPHGLKYNKGNEGAGYSDRIGEEDDELVPPGGSYTYTWTVDNVSGPSDGDPDCITWLYHSHVSPVEDISSGLVGFLLTCRSGTLTQWENTRMFALYVSVVDENLSWYIDDNIATYTNGSVDKDDDDFQQSNKMHAINGYVYGHLPGLSACVGETIHWHMASQGTEVDVHSLAVSGHSFEYFNHSTDSVQLTVAEFATVKMIALTRGKWLVSCNVDSRDGMEAFLTIDNCNDIYRPDTDIVNIRRYHIAAEEMMWDYGPSGTNKYDGGSLTEEGSDSEAYFKKDAQHIGGVYNKVIFQEYSDFLFREKKVRGPDEEHLGYLGPVIRAEVGDLVQVVFYNKASRPYSIHPHGVQFSKLDEGSLYNDGNRGKWDDFVEPNTVHTYYWTVPEEVGPTLEDPPCLTRMYTSGVDVIRDTQSGLVGPMIVCRPGTLDEDGMQINVTKEFFLMFSVSDENKSWYLKDNINISGVDSNIDTDGDEFIESNLMHGINGRLYGNLHGLADLCTGGMVSWHLFSIGTGSDVHSATFNGGSFLIGQSQMSSVDLIPGSMKTLTMVPRHQGFWGLTCGSHKQYTAGMKAIYNVKRCGDATNSMTSLPSGKIVRKYIQISEMDWNYVPANKDIINDMPFSKRAAQFVEASPTQIGSTYRKALYVEYIDRSFTRKRNRRRYREDYLGILGPVIKVEVGDVLEIVLKNAATEREFSINAQGLYYTGVRDGRFHSWKSPGVMPGRTFIYRWNVTEGSGPGLGDPECITSIYYSDIDVVKDLNSGLIGPLIVCRKGALASNNIKRKNVDKDFAVYVSVIDENKSWYLEQSMQRVHGDPAAVDKTDEAFINSNRMHAINGFLYGNQPIPTAIEGNTVDWYLITMGTDMHSVHFHGNDVVYSSNEKHTKDVIAVLPLVPATVRMRAINPGKWLYYCHVGDHYADGMQALYEVQKKFTIGPHR